MLWDWEEYFDGLGDLPSHLALQSFSQKPGYGFKATDVSSALKGCPALNDLEVELYHPVDGDEMGYNDPDDDTADFPEHEVLNIDVYGDKFCEALAKYCPLLTKFSIWEVAEAHNNNLIPIRTFTDHGLVTLAQLKYLTMMELRTINCTGNGVFEFLNSLSDEFMGQRTFQICIGGHPSDYRLAFYDVLSELLMQLEARTPEELAWGHRKFVLRLKNSNFNSVEPSWSEQYLRGLEPLVKNVKKIYPNLRLRIMTSGRRGSTFRSIIELGLYTANAKPSPWYGWDDENHGSTFVNRGGNTTISDEALMRLPVELRHPELLDPDSLPIDYELPADYFDDYGGFGDYDNYFDEDDDGYYDGNADELWE
ncbi:hypothetical protein PHPALM_17676 [Phytophthora palmivora]|uniref:Uncharacterized protein n=1 Tax=Phytophthora palmivora TaxID=4796 RepID=A0A2P4XLM4_9STRA|nr:hypothetical protein PHPALM_17676 [Phytophthora palmivora]